MIGGGDNHTTNAHGLAATMALLAALALTPSCTALTTGVQKEAPRAAGDPAVKEGNAYFLVKKRGVATLDASGFCEVPELPPRWLKGIHPGRGQIVWVISQDGGWKVEDGTTIPRDGLRFADAVAEGADGTLWAIVSSRLVRISGGRIEKTERADIGPDVRVLMDVEVGTDGAVYLAYTGGVARRGPEGDWEVIPLRWAPERTTMLTPVSFIKGLVQGPDGALYVLEDSAVFRVEGDEAVDLGLPVDRLFNGLALSPAGDLVVLHDLDELVQLTAEGKITGRLSVEIDAIPGNEIEAFAVDDRSRIWVSTEAGVSVVTATGEPLAHWPMGTVGELAGLVKEIVVMEGGPEQLPPAGERRLAGIRGQLLQEGVPLARAPVEICPEPDFSAKGSTPCAASDLAFATKTDAQGWFTVSDLPVGSYGLAFQAGNLWIATTSGRYAIPEPGEVVELEPIDIPSRPITAEDLKGIRVE